MSPLFLDYPPQTLQRFKDFHGKHPEVFEAFARFAREIKGAGFNKYSARTIVERMRWEHDLRKKKGEEPFFINGDHVPIMARLLVYKDPRFKDFFEMRKVRSQGRKSEEQQKRETA